MRFIATALSCATLVVAADWGSRLSKPAIHPNLDFVEDGLQRYLPEITFTATKWWNNSIPSICKDRGINAQEYDIYEIAYDDCSIPWILCHNRNSANSVETFARQFSKVPIGMRQWVRALMDIPAEGTSAYSYDGILAVYKANDRMISVLIHESAHSTVPNPDDGYRELFDAYDQDVGVPDDYAQTNMAENLAQVTVITVFDLNVPGGIPSVDGDWWKMKNQINAMKKYGTIYGTSTSLHIPGQNQACVHHRPLGDIVEK